MIEDFTGFPRDMFKFLRELKRNNDRDWFNANKDRYKSQIVAPMQSFISEMDGRLGKVSECFIADPRPTGGSMFRIYRDVRFSKDKSPYKTHVACQFRHMAGKDAHAVGFYVHLEPGEIFFGGGIWTPPTPVVRQIRDAIDADQAGWKKATRSRAFKNRFGELRGDQLKRPPQGYSADHPLVDDLRRKSFFAMQQADEKTATSPKFAAEVQKTFIALKPMMTFLSDAVGVPFDLED